MLKIQTTRFGEVEVEDQSIILVQGGIIGFARYERYMIIEHKSESPFFWLQAVDSPDLAFVIVDPCLFMPDYNLALSEPILADLKAQESQEVAVHVLVTIPHGRPQEMTANLLGPLVINTQAKLARQIIVDDERYSHRHPIISA
ncbi:MAG: flagellar assembly protein FliW [Candidatus Adiutricales bacterium]